MNIAEGGVAKFCPLNLVKAGDQKPRASSEGNDQVLKEDFHRSFRITDLYPGCKRFYRRYVGDYPLYQVGR